MKRRLAILSLAVCGTLPLTTGAQIIVPIYIEDSHAGSFYWLAQHLDPEDSCTLIHFDAHSDASAIFDSDVIRQRLRRVSSLEERARLLELWRKDGVVQCFNWIEPLMPAPIASVIWVPAGDLSKVERAQMQSEAANRLDGHLEAAPRSAGTFRDRYRVLSLNELEDVEVAGPVVVTIDLDSFAGLSPGERSNEFERVWKFVTERPNLRAVTFAISRPYLANDAEADMLLQLALEGALSLPTAKIEFAPFQTVGNDQSLRARQYRAQRRQVPAFALSKSSRETRALLLANQARVVVRRDVERWLATLQEWRDAAPIFSLLIKDHDPSTDDVWRVPVNTSAEVEVNAEPWDADFQTVRWIAQLPQYLRCNLSSIGANETVFARGAPPRPRWREINLPFSGRKLPLASLAPFFDRASGCGAVRIKARIESGRWVRETKPIQIRRFKGTGFRAALSEQFGLPYLFGSGGLRDGADTGPETGLGADCANFLIYAMRRQGLRVPWSNPRRLRNYLDLVSADVRTEDAPAFSVDELERGVILHFGSHVAALMEDRPPFGVLNEDDIVVHQLEGAPETISVRDLLRSRKTRRFDLLRIPASGLQNDLLIGGDVMLGRSVGDEIKAGVDPFAGIRATLAGAKRAIVNLECVVSARGEPIPGRKLHLRAPSEAVAALRNAGINTVGLANNHASDFGPEALRDSIKRLRAAGVSVVAGDGDAPLVDSETGIALLALNDSGPSACDRPRLAEVIAQARGRSRTLIALVHWGAENTNRVTERQRELARWLIDCGVDLVAGSHPHCIQPLDYYHGHPIVYSLGNLVFDGAPTVPAWNRAQLLEVGVTGPVYLPALRLLPVSLDKRGFPQLGHRDDLTQR